MGRHALVNNVSIADLRKLKFIVPTLSEQCRIANILDKADAIRRKRRQAIKLINDFLRSVFLEMFGDPVTNPKGWKSFPLEELAEVVSGVTKGRKLDPSGLISVPYMRVANVQDGFIDLSEVKEIDVLPCDVAKYALKSGDVLLTEGGDPDKLGRGAVWYNQVEKCIHQNHIFRVRVKKTSETDPEFLSALIGSEYGKRFFLRAAKQTTGIATINSRQLKSFPVLCPPYQLQKKFDEIKQKVTRLSGSLSNAEKITGELFNSTSSFLLSRNEG
jgi:type I restriction enzyme S subunit